MFISHILNIILIFSILKVIFTNTTNISILHKILITVTYVINLIVYLQKLYHCPYFNPLTNNMRKFIKLLFAFTMTIFVTYFIVKFNLQEITFQISTIYYLIPLIYLNLRQLFL